MDVVTFVAYVRDHYLEQFHAFAAEQRAARQGGVSEVKLKLGEGSGLLEDLFCVDFLVDEEGGPHAIEFHPHRALQFEPFEAEFGEMHVRVEELRWDQVVVRYGEEDGAPDPELLQTWFAAWFDPADLRAAPANDADESLSGVVHSVALSTGALQVDFGSAPPEAFWSLLQVLEESGVERVRIGGAP